MVQRVAPNTNGAPQPEDRDDITKHQVTLYSFLDPETRVSPFNDPVAELLRTNQWRDRQQHGRLTYEEMIKHPAVRTPFEFLIAFITTIEHRFAAPQDDPSPKQKEMAEFLNAQLSRLTWSKVIDGFFGQGLEFGFSLAELETRVAPWKGRPFVQVNSLTPLPQASLDNAPITQDEFNTVYLDVDRRYTCFSFDDRGRVTAYHQYRGSSFEKRRQINWETRQDKLRILHYTHNGGDGNPFGESLLWPAFIPWSDLYIVERQEQVFLEHALPWITASYEGDSAKPALHEQIKILIDRQDPAKRALIGNNIAWGKVTASDPDYADHLKQKKKEQRDYITRTMLMPASLYDPSAEGDDLDTRNILQVFFRFTLPAILAEIAEVMEEQFGKRLIDSNYANVESRDYPVFRFRIHLTSELRASLSLVQQLIPYVDTERLGEMAEAMIPGYLREWIAPLHDRSVSRDRPIEVPRPKGLPDTNPSVPPPKEEGETREDTSRPDGNIGQTSRTSV